ncbi:hypothetical protein IFO70_14645 [Phormidium tenue FACHB-886]|nr:hypothetical protein [Phormidium tenue FACHB-886]
MSLQQSWQQRRQALTDQQRYVRQILDRFQQSRYVKVIAPRYNLPQNLPMFQAQLQPETRPSLEQASAQPQMQTNRLMQRLFDVTQRLRQQTAELLSLHTADRALMAEQLSQELSDFHIYLTTTAATLRHIIQQQMQQVRSESRELQLYQHQQQIQLMQELANCITMLQAEVKNQLIELSLIRQARSPQIQQLLQSSRQSCLTEMATLRAELQAFCTELHQTAYKDTPETTALSAAENPADISKSDETTASRPDLKPGS